MLYDEIYELNNIIDTFNYDVYYIGSEEEKRIDKIVKNMYGIQYLKYFKIVLYLNNITYVDELLQGYLLKKFDLDEVLLYLRKKGFDI